MGRIVLYWFFGRAPLSICQHQDNRVLQGSQSKGLIGLAGSPFTKLETLSAWFFQIVFIGIPGCWCWWLPFYSSSSKTQRFLCFEEKPKIQEKESNERLFLLFYFLSRLGNPQILISHSHLTLITMLINAIAGCPFSLIFTTALFL